MLRLSRVLSWPPLPLLLHYRTRTILLLAVMSLPPLVSPAAATTDPAVLMEQGHEAFQRGAFGEAYTVWKETAQLYGAQHDVARQGHALVGAAHAAHRLGRLTEAMQSLELALVLARSQPDVDGRAAILAQLGRVLLDSRHLDQAGEYLDQADALLADHPSPALRASVTHDHALLAARRHQPDLALTRFLETIRLADHTGLRALALHARVNAARTALQLGRHAESRAWLDQALGQTSHLTANHDTASAWMNIGLLYRQLAAVRPDLRAPLLLRAAGALQEATAIAEQIGDTRSASYALGYLGRLYETDARQDDALFLTRQAVFAAQAADAPESLYRWQWQLGRLLGTTGHLDDAIAAYQHAVATLQPIRQDVAAAQSDDPLSDHEPLRPLFFELADLLLQRATSRPDSSAQHGDVLAARDAIEAFKAAELREYFKDDCVDALQARMTPSDRMANDTAVIYPIVFPTRLELLVSLPSELRRITVPVTAEALTHEIRTFRRLIEKRTTHEYLPHAQQLYQWLIRPLEPALQGVRITTLVFVPDSALRTIPMAALHDGQAFLIEHYAVASIPGLALTDPHPLDRRQVRVLTTGLTASVQGFPALPYVRDELDAIQALYGGQRLENQDFKIPLLEDELRTERYGMLHIATHGQFSAESGQSFLLTFDGRLTMPQLDRLIGRLRFRRDPLELLTLSACQSGAGDDRAALGLAGVAIQAGARSALASLWFINDAASTTLISEFYRHLREPSVSKAAALQRAQQQLLSDRVFAHPAYWSAFLLLNNWL